MTCSIQLQGITAPPPVRRFLDHFCAAGGMEDAFGSPVIILNYYTTKAVRGPITKINQSDRSIAGPIFSKYWTGYCPE